MTSADLTPAQEAEVDRLFRQFPGSVLAHAIAEGRARQGGFDPLRPIDDMPLEDSDDAALAAGESAGAGEGA